MKSVWRQVAGVAVMIGIPRSPFPHDVSAGCVKEVRIEHVFRYAHVYPRCIAMLASGTIEATRLAPGRKNHNRFEINGSAGSLAFDLERMNELEVYLADDDVAVRGFHRVLATEAEHPFVKSWWPPGHIIGYEHTFVHTVYDLLEAVNERRVPEPNFHDGLKNQLVLAAIEQSSAARRWVAV